MFGARVRVVAVLVVLGGVFATDSAFGQHLRHEVLYKKEGVRLGNVAVLPVTASEGVRELVGSLNLKVGKTGGFRAILGEVLATSIQSWYPQRVRSPDATLDLLKANNLTDEYVRLAQQFEQLGVVDSTLASTIDTNISTRYFLVPVFSYSGRSGEAQLTAFLWDDSVSEEVWRGLAQASTAEWNEDVLDGLMESFLTSLPLPADSDS